MKMRHERHIQQNAQDGRGIKPPRRLALSLSAKVKQKNKLKSEDMKNGNFFYSIYHSIFYHCACS